MVRWYIGGDGIDNIIWMGLLMYTVHEINGFFVILKNEYKEFARYPLDKLKEAEQAAKNMNALTKDWSGNANF